VTAVPLAPALAILLAATGLSAAAPKETPAARAPKAPMVVAEVPPVDRTAAAIAGGTIPADLGERGRLVLVRLGAKPRVLTASFHSAADPEVSFDGKSILFAGRRAASDPWCVFEMKVEGGEPRQITCGRAGARQPVYQSTIYTITPTSVEPWVQVAFVGENPGERNEAGVAPNTSLWSCKTDGTALRRLTFNLSNDRDPEILPDGRMVYAGWLRAPGREPADRVALLGVNEDGTDYQTYAGDQGLRVKQMPAAAANGLLVFVEAERIAGDGSGRLASVSQVRPLHSYRSLTGTSDGYFRAPSSLPDGRLLVAWRSSESPFAIHRLDPLTGAHERVFGEDGWESVEAKVIAPRPMPDARSSVVRDDDPEGRLYTIDVGIQAPGQAMPKGVVTSVRVVEGVAATADRPVLRRLLGDVEVADDGSYQVQIPANVPVQLELLDASGAVLRTSAWLWVRNHAAQGCVGCHEDPERTPPNRLMKALQAPAPVLDPPAEKRRTLSDAGGARPASADEVRAFVRSIEAGGQP
jgi:Tol biopolymer transport system component